MNLKHIDTHKKKNLIEKTKKLIYPVNSNHIEVGKSGQIKNFRRMKEGEGEREKQKKINGEKEGRLEWRREREKDYFGERKTKIENKMENKCRG